MSDGMMCKHGSLCFYAISSLIDSFVLTCMFDAVSQWKPNVLLNKFVV